MTTTLRIGSYNAEFGHPAKAHAEMIWWRFEHLQLDLLCVVEARDYLADLIELTPPGHRVLYRQGRRGENQQIILVRDASAVGHVYSYTAGLPYPMPNGGTMPPEQPLVAHYRGAVFVARHAPVQAWVADPHDHGRRKWIGGVQRLAAYRHSQVRTLKVFQRHTKPVLALGDWNATPATTGPWSPAWLLRKAGAEWFRTHRNTGHGEIDFGIVRGVKVLTCKVDPDPPHLPHSDHRLIHGQVSF